MLARAAGVLAHRLAVAISCVRANNRNLPSIELGVIWPVIAPKPALSATVANCIEPAHRAAFRATLAKRDNATINLTVDVAKVASSAIEIT